MIITASLPSRLISLLDGRIAKKRGFFYSTNSLRLGQRLSQDAIKLVALIGLVFKAFLGIFDNGRDGQDSLAIILEAASLQHPSVGVSVSVNSTAKM